MQSMPIHGVLPPAKIALVRGLAWPEPTSLSNDLTTDTFLRIRLLSYPTLNGEYFVNTKLGKNFYPKV